MADLILPSTLATFDPLGGSPFPPLMTGHDGICIHTMAGSFAGTDSMFHENGWSGTESTVGIAGSGQCKEWVPWNRQADAMLDGNPRWLSIECADAGENFPPSSQANDENPPLTSAQIDKIVALCTYWCDVRNHANCPTSWTCHKQGIPARWIATSCERGIGVHRHGIDQTPGNTTPGPWRDPNCPKWSEKTGKICPRSVRLRQVRDIVVPRVQAALNQEDDDMPAPKDWDDQDKAVIRNIIRQEMYGDPQAHTKGQTPIVRNEVKAITETMLTTKGSVLRDEGRNLAELGAQDAAPAVASAVEELFKPPPAE